MTEFRTEQLIALGGNLPSRVGTPAETLGSAIAQLAAEGVRIRALSRFFSTPCFPAGAGPDFVNAAIRVHSRLAPAVLLDLLHGIEAAHGRIRGERWAGRSLDMDLLAAGDLVLPSRPAVQDWMTLPAADQARTSPDRLILPHPRIQDRGFVLVPLADVAPDWVHPILGQSVRDMVEGLPEAEKSGIRPI